MNFPQRFVSCTYERTSYERHIPAPIFRHLFELKEVPERAEILISGLGFYDLWLNGEKITKGLLAPYISNPDDIVYYDSYDVAELLHEGANVVAVMLGTGMQNPITSVWDFEWAKHNAAPCFAFSFESENLRFTAEDFLCSESEITFNNYRSGVHCDARLKQDAWNEIDFDASDWRPVLPAPQPRGKAKLCEADPIRVQAELKAVSIRPGKMRAAAARGDVVARYQNVKLVETASATEGGYIYDFGVNTAGIIRLKIKGEPGQKVSIQFAERLSDGDVDPTNITAFYPDGYGQRDIYICRGDEAGEVFEPPFVYHGFRYAYVTGIREDQATEDLLIYLEAHSDIRSRVSFESSSERVNQLWTITERSDRSNFHYFPTDCPHREKNGWTGDAAMSAEHMVLTLTVEESLREWLFNIRAAQNESGALPGIVPTTGWGFDWGNGPAWDSVLFFLPYTIYQYRGDTRVIHENAHAMLRYLDYIAGRRDERGIVEIGLGDWCPVGRAPEAYKLPLGLTDSIMVMSCSRMAAELFEAVDMTVQASFARTLEREMREAIRCAYLDPSTMLLAGNCQSAQAMGLYYGVYDQAERAEAFKRLMEIIEADGRHMDVGFLGGRVLFHVLSDFGQTELAFHMITKPDYPSYGNLLERGATSLWEMFLPEGQLSGSENHHFWGDINHWFVRQLAGINVNPKGGNPNHILIKPRFVAALDFVKASYEAVDASLQLEWRREGDVIVLDIHADEGLEIELALEQGYVFQETGLAYSQLNAERFHIVKR